MSLQCLRRATWQSLPGTNSTSIHNQEAVVSTLVHQTTKNRTLADRKPPPSIPSALYSTHGISLHSKEPWPHPAQRDSLLHVVLSCIDLLKPGELQPPIGCVAGEARPETLECLLDSFRPVCRFKQKGILSGFGIKS